MKNSGLGCGCGCSQEDNTDLGFLTPAPVQTAPVSQAPLMTATWTTGRRDDLPTVAAALLGHSYITYFREGIALGMAWAATRVNGVTTPVQWNHEMAVASIRATQQIFGAPSVLDRQVMSAADRNRMSFIFGFDIGVQLFFGLHTTLIANGQVFTLDALRTQGRVAANSVFEQPRAPLAL